MTPKSGSARVGCTQLEYATSVVPQNYNRQREDIPAHKVINNYREILQHRTSMLTSTRTYVALARTFWCVHKTQDRTRNTAFLHQRHAPPPRRQQKYHLYTCMPATTVRQLVLSRSAWQKLSESHDASLELYRVREQETNHKGATTTPANRVRAVHPVCVPFVHPSKPQHAGRPWAVGRGPRSKVETNASVTRTRKTVNQRDSCSRHRAQHSRHLSLTLLSQSTVLLPLSLPLSSLSAPNLARFGTTREKAAYPPKFRQGRTTTTGFASSPQPADFKHVQARRLKEATS